MKSTIKQFIEIATCNNTNIFQVSDIVQGTYYDFLRVFSKMLNFKTRLFQRIDRKWGIFNKESGKWEGMIENLQNGEADLIATSFTVTRSRVQAVDFILPLSENSMGFAVKSKEKVQ